MKIPFEQIRTNPEVNALIKSADKTMESLGFTEHSYVHAGIVSKNAADVLTAIGASEHEVELAKIAGYMHDIGNMVNRHSHAQTGAILAYDLLRRLDMDIDDAIAISGAIGNHDEGTGNAISAISAALILADKSDVRKSRVRNKTQDYDIHDRVNSAVEKSSLITDTDAGIITVKMTIDTSVSSVMDYFEIFLARMIMCRKAADFFDMRLKIKANDMVLL